MKRGKRILKIFLLAAVLAFIFYYFIINENNKKYYVITWDNIYNENNLRFFYEDNKDILISSLNKVYKVDQIVDSEKDIHEKVLKIIDLLHNIVEYDNVNDSNYNNAYTILQQGNTIKKVSQKDMAIIARDLILTQGIPCRIGEFRSEIGPTKKEQNYYIVEYWNEEFNKWIMIDFMDRGYFINKKIPCSAIEVLEYKVEDFSYIGQSEKKEYLKHISGLLESYTIAIDNTIGRKMSNCLLTYLYKDTSNITLEFKGIFTEPTIFTQNKYLFSKNPYDKQIEQDEKAYLVIMKINDLQFSNSNNKSKDINDKVVIGAFKDGKIIDQYYLKINDGEYELVEKYKEYDFLDDNNIQLSLDGITDIATIEILVNN